MYIWLKAQRTQSSDGNCCRMSQVTSELGCPYPVGAPAPLAHSRESPSEPPGSGPKYTMCPKLTAYTEITVLTQCSL